ncbi:hypothetical protein PoB_002868400 [Plakobranchus ocellatus]|uniref:Uncharacterized protein n=1 Tax=Plakobranchus ocellatus TaxID=259542 RepID=A0AAV4A3C8_9GAST|nr:hypothetical protein PoB_002868400 [Plakobranchus ocellatus]
MVSLLVEEESILHKITLLIQLINSGVGAQWVVSPPYCGFEPHLPPAPRPDGGPGSLVWGGYTKTKPTDQQQLRSRGDYIQTAGNRPRELPSRTCIEFHMHRKFLHGPHDCALPLSGLLTCILENLWHSGQRVRPEICRDPSVAGSSPAPCALV